MPAIWTTPRFYRAWTLLIVLALTLVAASRGALPARAAGTSFADPLTTFNTTLWGKSDGWSNGGFFNTGWEANNITFANGRMTLTTDNVGCPCSGKPYASGEYRSNDVYGYGRYQARFKPVNKSGMMAGSIFTYTGPADGNPWDEIDIEFLGKDMTSFQTNYFTNGVGDHEHIVQLGFDASADFHTYAFDWTPSEIRWYVDGNLVHTENGSNGTLPSTPGRFMANAWPGTGVDGWLGSFSYSGPLNVEYEHLKYVQLTSTDIAQGKPTTASSMASTAYASSYAVDGNATTRWASQYSDPQWMRVDLGATYAIDRVVLNWHTNYGKDYTIQVSPDGTTWTTIHTVTNGNGGTDDIAPTGSPTTSTGRYVRMYGTARATTISYSLYAFKVYGRPV